MDTALRELCILRNEDCFEIDKQNQNRYRIVVKDGSASSAYCFCTPIYNRKTKKLVHRRFEEDGEAFFFEGSNSRITVYKGNVILANMEGSVTLDLPSSNYSLQDGILCGNGWSMTPTFNGIYVQINQSVFSTRVRISRRFGRVRITEKNFSVMQDPLTPFFTCNPLMATDENKKIYPAKVRCNEINELEYTVGIAAMCGEAIAFEFNLYEPKLFLDTTVESAHPFENNAFGSAAFLGKTNWLGEQWLYTRPDFSKIPEIYSHPINRILLHIPCWFANKNHIAVFAPVARFCSFGSTWENKIEHTKQLVSSVANGNYITIDLTGVLYDSAKQSIFHTNGIILKCVANHDGYVAIATGDNYVFPQILEVRYD